MRRPGIISEPHPGPGKLEVPQDNTGAQVRTVDAKDILKELHNAARYREHYFVGACCGKNRIYQDLLERATQTIISIEVLKEF